MMPVARVHPFRAGSSGRLPSHAVPVLVPQPVLVLLIVTAFSCMAPESLGAADRAAVPNRDDEWRLRLGDAFGNIARGDVASGLRVLSDACEEGEDILVEVPDDLSAPFEELHEIMRPTQRRRPGARRFSRARGRRFISLDVVARVLLSRFSDDDLEEYRERSGTLAEALWRTGRHPEAEQSSGQGQASGSGGDGTLPGVERLHEIASRYPMSTRGIQAREVVGDLYLEAGAMYLASSHYGELLRSESRTPELVSRLGIKLLFALRSLGESTRYLEARARLSERLAAHGASARSFRSELRGLESRVELIDRELKPRPLRASRWGGELDVGKPPSLPSSRLELSWDSEVWSERGIPLEDLGFPSELRRFGGRVISSYDLEFPFVPLLQDNRVWLPGVFQIFEFDARAGHGKALRKLQKPDPARLGYRFIERGVSPVYSLTLWRRAWDTSSDQILADLPDEILIGSYLNDRIERTQFMNYEVSAELPIRALVAFDPESGERLWRTRPQVAERNAPAPRRPVEAHNQFAPVDVPADISYSSPVLVRGDRIFASGWSEEGFVNSLVRALDSKTGETIWETHLTSSQMEMTMFGELAREPFASFLEERDGIIYCATNLGALAALDADSGRIRWLTTYDVLPTTASMGQFANLRELVWGLNPPMLIGHLLIATPRDSRFLYAIDTGLGPDGEGAAGRVHWIYDNANGDLQDLLGFYRERLYFTGKAGVSYLDLSELDSTGRLRRGTFPRKLLAAGTGLPRQRLGAGCLMSDGVVTASSRGLSIIDLDFRQRPRALVHDAPRDARLQGGAAALQGRGLQGRGLQGRGLQGRGLQGSGRVQWADGRFLVTSNHVLSAFFDLHRDGGKADSEDGIAPIRIERQGGEP